MRRISSEPFILMYTIIFAMHIAALPQLFLKKICLRSYNGNTTICSKLDDPIYKTEQDYCHKQSSIWMMIFVAATLVPSLFTILVLGSFSDKWGRKKAMFIPPIGLVFQSLVFFVNSIEMTAHPAFLVIGAIFTAVYGDFQGAVALAYSYMADVTKKDSNRTMKMAIVEGMVFFAGAPAGIGAGFILYLKFGFVILFLTTAGLSMLTLLHTIFILPPVQSERKASQSSQTPILDHSSIESMEKENDDSQHNNQKGDGNTGEESSQDVTDSSCAYDKTKRINKNPFAHIKNVFHLISDKKLRGRIIPFIVAFGFSVMAFTGELYITVLFVKHQPLSLSAEEVGFYLASQAVIRGLGVIFTSQLTVRCCHFSDETLVYIGLLSQCTNYILIALSKSKLMLYLVTLTGVTMPLATSGLRCIITKQVDSSKYGAVLGAIEAVDVVCANLSNIIVNTVYFNSISSYMGVAFYVLAGFSFLSFVIFAITGKTSARQSLEL